MRTLTEIDFFSDEVLRRRLVWLSLAFLVPVVALCIVNGYRAAVGKLEPILLLPALFSSMPELSWLFWFALITIVILPIHELIHALFFKLMGGPNTHVIFGYRDGMLYAGCPGKVLSKASFVTVLLAPAVLVSLACLVAAFTMSCPMLCIAILLTHLSGCTGDLLAVYEIARNKACICCEDTEQGIKLLGD